MVRTNAFMLAIFLLGAIILGGPPSLWAWDKEFKGKVIDADTREPLEGAVVVAYWYEAWGTLAGEPTRLKDVKETLTDKDGRWSITGPEGRFDYHFFGLLFFVPYTRHPNFIVFKPGYCPWPGGYSIAACKGKIKPRGIGEIMEGEDVEISKFTNREDRLKTTLGPITPTDNKRYEEFIKKQKKFIKLIEQERGYLGLQKYNFKFLED